MKRSSSKMATTICNDVLADLSNGLEAAIDLSMASVSTALDLDAIIDNANTVELTVNAPMAPAFKTKNYVNPKAKNPFYFFILDKNGDLLLTNQGSQKLWSDFCSLNAVDNDVSIMVDGRSYKCLANWLNNHSNDWTLPQLTKHNIEHNPLTVTKNLLGMVKHAASPEFNTALDNILAMDNFVK